MAQPNRWRQSGRGAARIRPVRPSHFGEIRSATVDRAPRRRRAPRGQGRASRRADGTRRPALSPPVRIMATVRRVARAEGPHVARVRVRNAAKADLPRAAGRPPARGRRPSAPRAENWRTPRGEGRRPSFEATSPTTAAGAREEPRATKPSQAMLEATKVQTITVTPDEAGMRVDRFSRRAFRACRSATSSASSARARCGWTASAPSRRSGSRPGQQVRIPPLKLEAPKPPRR